MNILIATLHSWHIRNASEFMRTYQEHKISLLSKKEDFTREFVDAFQPEYIFFPHWSYFIPEWAYAKYECIVFHPSDLPNGRGGSPIQNQIHDGLTRTMISAIKVEKELDAGDIYLQRELSLMGGAEEIMIRESKIIFNDMIPAIIENKLKPIPQKEGGFVYKRRKPEQSELPKNADLISLFDHIRMLDAEGYPAAFLDYGSYRLVFTRPKLSVSDILCDVSIQLRKEN